MAFSYSPKIVTDGLVLYLDAANPASYVSGSTVWNDLSRSQTSGSLNSNVIYNNINAGGFFLTGSSNNAITFPTPNPSNPSELTLDIALQVSASAFSPILRYGASVSTLTDKITFRGNNDNSGNTSILLYANTSTGQTLVSFALDLKTNSTITLTLDNQGSVKFYKNSTLINSTTVANFLTWQITTSGSFIFSQNNYIYSFKVYNRALTQTEVLQNYNATKGRFGLT